MHEIIEKLAHALLNSSSTVVFTGAGMSTESGLPDFRSPGGLWGKYRPEDLASTDALNRNFENFAAFYRQRMETLGEVRPNSGHLTLAEWERKGLVSAIVTQNVDGLHQAAGSKAVHELHGTLRMVRCQSCGREFPAELFSSETACGQCGGKLRPAVVLFGEMLPERTLAEATDLASSCSLFLVLGSSLAVSPANLLPERAKRHGAWLFIVNNTPTHLDFLADGVIRGSIGDVLGKVNEMIRKD
ncbi:MAG: NAD-dependent deacylase [Aminivibrio sp.]|uniref:NAD-dependent deacylase n=1 Tax=Aminivibrio sp. TaxID=1872489 RepID=UPI002B1FE82F|nr:NAD-dependent deacylase [Aminivibrio sp.]MEA4952933.1 NAD-dependent deacylase [Aminivibrio sp.]